MKAWESAPEDPFRQTNEGFRQQIAVLENFDIRAEIPNITVPTLLVSSSDDLLVPPHFQEEIAELIPHAQIKTYHGGHVFMSLPMYQEVFFKDAFAFWDEH